MKKTFVSSVLITLTSFSSMALSPLTSELEKESAWTKRHLSVLFLKASPNFKTEEIETYKPIDRYFSNVVYPHFSIKHEDFFSTSCTKFSKDVRRESSAWRLSNSFLFRYPKKGLQSFSFLGEGDVGKLTSQYPNSGFIFSGGWIPKIDSFEFRQLMSVMTSKVIPGSGLQVKVEKNEYVFDDNKYEFYSDLPAPVSITYKKYNGNLIGQIKDKEGQIAGYKVCYKSQKVFCYAEKEYAQNFDSDIKYTARSMNLSVGENQEEAKANLLTEMRESYSCKNPYSYSYEECSAAEDAKWIKKSCSTTYPYLCENLMNACQAFHQAVNTIKCADDTSKLNIRVWEQGYDGVSKGKYVKPTFY